MLVAGYDWPVEPVVAENVQSAVLLSESSAHDAVVRAISVNDGASDPAVDATVIVFAVVPQITEAVEPKLKFASNEVVPLFNTTVFRTPG
jgi:hypothetical protein